MTIDPKKNSGPNIIWQPQEGSQKLFLSCPIFETLYEGTRGPGKTDALLMDFAQHVGAGFGASWRGVLFRQTYKQLSDVISKSKKWFYKIFPGVKFNASASVWEWETGEQLFLRQFLREDDYYNYHGHEYPWIGWEELCNWHSPSGYLALMSCCRSTMPNIPKKIRATTNSYGPGHNWVKDRFRLPHSRFMPIMDSKDLAGNTEPPRIAIFGSIHENKLLLAQDPEYINRIRISADTEAKRKSWLEGSWDIVAGGMFDDVWSPRSHVIEPFNIPDSWSLDRSFDWGSSKPFSVGWWARSDGTSYVTKSGEVKQTKRGDLFRIAEWYGSTGKPNEGLKILASEISYGIIEREIKMGIYGRVKPGPADSAIFTAENGNCIATDMAKPVNIPGKGLVPGILWIPADKSPGSRKTGWEQCRAYFKNSAAVFREYPGMFIFNTCHQFLRTVPVLPRDKKDMDDLDTESEDHIADEMRYRVRSEGVNVSSGRLIGNY